MKGFYTGYNYCGWIDGKYYIFVSESDYKEAYYDYYNRLEEAEENEI